MHKKKFVGACLVAMLMVAGASPAYADETCTGTIGNVTIEDNVIVPEGADCVLNGTTVKGNVLVGPDSTLTADGATVEGNIQTDNSDAAAVTVVDSMVDGNIQVFDSVAASVTDTTVGGSVQFDGNDGDLSVGSSEVNGDVQLFDNDGGAKDVTGNTIGGNLQCKGNDPAPTGGNNTVDGNQEDQCANLSAPPPGSDQFTDVPAGSVFAADITALADAGITAGCNPPTNDRFCPDEEVERGQMAAFLVRALDLPAGSATFTDVPAGSVFAADITALADAGITIGCNPPANDRFCPDEEVERGQMAAFLVRALDLPAGSATFTDVPAGSVFAADIAALADAGITIGCNPPANDRFCPDEAVERQQMAAFLVRAGLTD